MAPASAKLITAIMADEPPQLDASPYLCKQ
jgi:glycine/D-amino acid oxidase-like deaminating enzyme